MAGESASAKKRRKNKKKGRKSDASAQGAEMNKPAMDGLQPNEESEPKPTQERTAATKVKAREARENTDKDETEEIVEENEIDDTNERKRKLSEGNVEADDDTDEMRKDTESGTEDSDKKKSKKKKSKKDKKRRKESVEGDGDDKILDQDKPRAADTVATVADTDDKATVDEETAIGSIIKPGFFADAKFASLPLSDATQVALKNMGYETMTKIQHKAIPPLLSGKDLIGAAKTGSGKTLAFLIPIIELLSGAKFSTRNGTGAMVMSPTRELAMQTFGVCKDILTNKVTGSSGATSLTYGLVMGGANRKTEEDRLRKGVAIVIATPGRLLDHLKNTSGFNTRNLLVLCIDEADRILEIGFEEDLRAILKLLPKERQTMLFSATQTKQIQDLARVSINPKTAVYVEVDSDSKEATTENLEQGYVTCPSDKRFLLLFTFLKKNKNKKIMVFFSSCNSVKFHAELLNYIDIPVMDIHGRQKQVKRTTTFFQFQKAKSATLLCTDVAARGLDIPSVDWIIQFDPPDDPKEYIHRVGRTARGATGSGRALLFLTPEETGFLRYLQAATKVTLNEYEFPTHKVANVQSQLQSLIEKNYYLNRAARDAYRSYLLAYASHSHREIFNVHELDLQAVGLAFGFSTPPRVDLALSVRGNKRNSKNNQNKVKAKSGHGFSASNPYGKRETGDSRQFSY